MADAPTVEVLSKDQLRQLLDEIPGVIWTTDTELRCTSIQGSGLAVVDLAPG